MDDRALAKPARFVRSAADVASVSRRTAARGETYSVLDDADLRRAGGLVSGYVPVRLTDTSRFPAIPALAATAGQQLVAGSGKFLGAIARHGVLAQLRLGDLADRRHRKSGKASHCSSRMLGIESVTSHMPSGARCPRAGLAGAHVLRRMNDIGQQMKAACSDRSGHRLWTDSGPRLTGPRISRAGLRMSRARRCSRRHQRSGGRRFCRRPPRPAGRALRRSH